LINGILALSAAGLLTGWTLQEVQVEVAGPDAPLETGYLTNLSINYGPDAFSTIVLFHFDTFAGRCTFIHH
jgi:hypothetical protein